ncbi:ABC transporter permease [Streptomyces cyaneofuscatus]|uniref:ABC transporter permease n=1 Tax=Streptomyces cyaneofuscatus TaxID=66883 RepID=UPI0033F9A7B9
MSQLREEAVSSSDKAAGQAFGQGGRRVVLPLAVVESRRLLLHPAVLITLAAYAALWIYSTVSGADRFPVLHDESRYTQAPALLVAAGTFLAVNLAVLRPVRDSMADLYEVVVLDAWQRVTAHALSVLPVAGVTLVAAALRFGLAAAGPDPVGSVVTAEVLTGPAVVLAAGALAVLTGTAMRSTAAGPLVLMGLGVLTVAAALAPTSSWRWLTLIAIEHESVPPLPRDLLDRPAEVHLLYLLCLTVLAALAALLLAGLRGRLVAMGAVLALVAVVGAGAAQFQPVPESTVEARHTARTAPAQTQRCTEVSNVTYCAFPDFFDRHRQWAEVAEGILHRIPGGGPADGLAVRQHIWSIDGGDSRVDAEPLQGWAEDDREAETPGAIMVGTRWGTGNEADSLATIGFAAAFANRTIDAGKDRGPVAQVCGARAVLVTWLAAQATPETRQALRDRLTTVISGTSVSFRPVDGVHALSVDRRGASAALTLLERPTDEVGARVSDSWEELTDPSTPLDRAAELLDFPAPPVTSDGGEGGC